MRVTEVQGWYYLLGGAWPLLHFRSFEAVAGPKPDRFQTQVTAALFVAVGAALLTDARSGELTRASRVLAVTSAAGTALLDWRYREHLRPVFRVEAALEILFAAASGASRSGKPDVLLPGEASLRVRSPAG